MSSLLFYHLHTFIHGCRRPKDRWVHVSFLCSSSGIGSNFNDSMMPLPVLEVEAPHLQCCAAAWCSHHALTMQSPCCSTALQMRRSTSSTRRGILLSLKLLPMPLLLHSHTIPCEASPLTIILHS